jgi:hypothetical protein
MPTEPILAALVALLSQPIAVASMIVVAGIHAAIWLLVFERVGFPPALASLMLLPPLTFLLPLYVALARWPSQRSVRLLRKKSARHHRAQHAAWKQPFTRPFTRPVMSGFHPRLPLRLEEDGLPRARIALVEGEYAAGRPIQRGAAPRRQYP